MTDKPRYYLTRDALEGKLDGGTFADVVQGRTRSKPKFIRNEAGALFRLVMPESGRPYYEELPLDSDQSYIMRLSTDAKQKALAISPEALPDPYRIRTFAFNDASAGFPPIHSRQLHGIMTAMGRPYRWSPAEFANQFQNNPFIVNLLFQGDHIVGMTQWGRLTPGSENSFTVLFMNVLDDSVRGHGLGKHLLHHTHRQMLSGGDADIYLATLGSYRVADNKRTVVGFYHSQGYEIVEEQHFDYELFKSDASAGFTSTVPEAFFRDPKTGEELPRFRKERLQQQMETIAKELLGTVSRTRS